MKNFKEKISPNPKPKEFNQHEMAGTKEQYLGINALIWPVVSHAYVGNRYV